MPRRHHGPSRPRDEPRDRPHRPRTGVARKEIVALAVERLRRQRVLESANAGFAAIKKDSAAWSEELEERGIWESTVADGLADE